MIEGTLRINKGFGTYWASGSQVLLALSRVQWKDAR